MSSLKMDQKIVVESTAEPVPANPPCVSPTDDVRIRRKIDRHMLPLMSAIYGLQFVSRETNDD